MECGRNTSRAYARAHNGTCKACATGGCNDAPNGLLVCPDCGEHTLTPYQKSKGYHCDACTRATDPEGYRREVMGLNDYQPDY